MQHFRMKAEGYTEIAYSTKVQKEISDQIKLSNWLKLFLILTFLLAIFMMFLIYTKTGIIGTYLVRAIC